MESRLLLATLSVVALSASACEGGPGSLEADQLAAPMSSSAASPSASPSPEPAPPPSADRPFVLQDADVSETRGHERTWDSARTDGERAVLVSFVGAEAGQEPCQAEYEGKAVLQGDAFHLSVTTAPRPPDAAPLPSEVVCHLVGYTRTVRVELPEPLAGRPVVDAKTGRPGPLLDGGALLHLPALPEGHRLDESGGLAAGPVWSHVYRTDDDRAPVLHVVHSADHGRPLDAHRILVERVTARSQEAVVSEQRDGERVVTREVTWRERGGIVSVIHQQTHLESPELLPVDDLVELARSLR